ncbi:transcription termination factor 2-like isoform X2 [Alosa sapidissima]|uniref:transcription termination factor 2-like isoform X2 n=1 Tax=Alosa sapidissima TaxID=34773 RepID=UPI001C080E3B|nr:transcription termination factor 2-like isoform X2 [Alosa sapidissima]
MEIVRCDTHGTTCLLKTGTRDGPNKGKSFYICAARQDPPCDFTHPADIPPSHCLHHEDSVVELQALIKSVDKSQRYRLYFRCALGKKEGQKWCDSVPWSSKEPEKRSPLTDKQLQASSLPPVRNPFKAPSKTDQTSEWRKLQQPEGKEGDARSQEQENQVREKNQDGERHGSSGEGGGEKKKKNDSNRTTGGGEGVEEEEGSLERSKTAPTNKRSTTEGKKSAKAFSPSPKPASEQTTEDRSGAVSPHESGLHRDKDKKWHAGKCRTSDSDSQHRTCSSVDTATEAPRHPHSASSSSSSSSSGGSSVEETPKASSGTPDSFASIAALAAQNNPSSAAERHQEAHKTPRDQSQRRSPVELNGDDDDDDDDDDEEEEEREDGSGDDDDDVQLVSVQPGPKKTSPVPPGAPMQKTLTSYFLSGSKLKLHSQLSAQLKQKKATLSMVNVSALPDKGQRLRSQVKELEDTLTSLSLTPLTESESQEETKEEQKPSPVPSPSNPFSRPGGTILLPDVPAPTLYEAPQSASSLSMGLSQGYTQMFGVDPQSHTFYGGRMTDSRLMAIRNATTETIDHLHKSLETCPGPDTEAKDPKGIKVQLLPHQRRALAWLLWREDQKPCGGILADDMGLGKTLTMIALILAQKKPKDEKDPKLEGWISKHDSSLVVSQGTLIICPASLVHHWKNEVERHIKSSRLSVYLYHGPNRQRNAKLLADYDVVVTTYNLVSKEIPVQKEEAERPSQDADHTGANLPPLLRVAWARVILDEAHNIKNPKVQTSMAVCKLRARARWAVTGTPIQNNLLDMYSLLKFMRCSPFDEYKLWKAQVDNGSKRGGERLNILTQALLLRRTKDQQDSTGKPLVDLPDRSCEVHRVKLSEDEQSVYDVVFARSKSTLQSYLRRHEGKEGHKGDGSNPFEKVANEFGVSQQGALSSSQQQQPQASSAVHILSLLLRLRQCCCHLSLLKKTLDQSELQGDGVTLSLEEQLNALSLGGEPPDPSADLKDTVCLNGSRFRSELFEDTRGSTKLSAVLTELKEIRRKDQKSVIVSQWTSMLRIVAVHLKSMGLTFGVIDGTVNIKHRMDLVEEFNTNPKGPQVMLVSLCAGGVGLNLVGGNHLFLIDMHWNPALEDQACDRIYRVGQHRDVTIHKFICEGTVEDKISSLQEKKKELAQKVLTGTGSTFTKLSLADLRVIFGV